MSEAKLGRTPTPLDTFHKIIWEKKSFQIDIRSQSYQWFKFFNIKRWIKKLI